MRILSRLVATLPIAIMLYVIGTDMAHAQTFKALAPDVGTGRVSNLYGSTSLAEFINRLFYAAIAVGAILAVMRFAFAGYLYMTTDAWGQKSKAKEVIGDVILGLLLLLSIWLILRQINPQILDLSILKTLQGLPK